MRSLLHLLSPLQVEDTLMKWTAEYALKIILYVFLWVRSSRNLFGEVIMKMQASRS
jgi:hypothetical protein